MVKNPDRARKTFQAMFLSMISLAGVLGVAVYSCKLRIARIYSSEPQMILIVVRKYVLCWLYLFDPHSHTHRLAAYWL